jgi:hypothetical protein
VETESKPRDDAEVAAPAADRPEQVGIGLLVDAKQLPVGRHDLRSEQVVDREAEPANEKAHAAAERDPPDPDRGRVAEIRSQARARRPPRCTRRP